MRRRPFNRLHALILRRMTEALFHGQPMAITPAQVVENMQDLFGQIEGKKPREIGWTLLVLALVLGGPFFIWGSPAFRIRRIEKRLQRTKVDLLQDLARIRGLIYAGYYGHWLDGGEDANRANPVLNALGFELPGHRTRGSEDVPVTAPDPNRDLPASAFVDPAAIPDEADVIVIGSGAGGATAAAELTRYGHTVLILEAGPNFPSSAITHEEKRMAARMFVDGGIQTTRDNDIIVFQGRVVGGSTVINNGICLRVRHDGYSHPEADDVLGQWHALGAPVPRAALDASYEQVESALHVIEADPLSGRHNGPHMLRGWAAFAARSTSARDKRSPARWFRKNWGGAKDDPRACNYCGYCNTGCAYGRKDAMPQSRLREASERGARILCNTTARRILWKKDKVDGKRVASGVEIRTPSGARKVVQARKGVVVAGGALASSRLLGDSGIDNAGDNISLNIACPVVALMPKDAPQRAWDEDQMTTYVDRGDFLLESHFQPPMSMATLVPGWFGEHFGRMHNYNRLASAGILFPADRCGRMKGGKLSFKLGTREMDLMRDALATLTKVHFAAGALEVYPALARGQTLQAGMTDAEIDAFYRDSIQEADDVTLSSSHPQGGNAIGTDPSTSVIDMEFRVHGTANVLVTDASVFPSCIRVNAQLTTMAMAHYAISRKDPFS
ncbi:GMC family oxidoreductase [Sphingomonas sp. C3-2]|uniref:GMC family oxidoreductase n=1 Tax=Sphingomonas sp. C3-2 TaxID=3062169 RepID=UPI00294AD05B|nr:GMC family oxidoreductase [Sphingomonas sp. C3-2]WOK35767.1 GMC family oxidoreductase [Sphingomonas sp. C3-2]